MKVTRNIGGVFFFYEYGYTPVKEIAIGYYY
jgi:hypothetical protein